MEAGGLFSDPGPQRMRPRHAASRSLGFADSVPLSSLDFLLNASRDLQAASRNHPKQPEGEEGALELLIAQEQVGLAVQMVQRLLRPSPQRSEAALMPRMLSS